jgi:uncharacterized membrane protein
MIVSIYFRFLSILSVCMCMCMCVCVCVSVFGRECVSVHMWAYVGVCAYINIVLYIALCVSQYRSLRINFRAVFKQTGNDVFTAFNDSSGERAEATIPGILDLDKNTQPLSLIKSLLVT